MFYQIKFFFVFFFLFSNVLLIAAEEQTPDRASGGAALTSPETPGQFAHRLQIEFFSNQRGLIQRVLGQDFVETLPSFAELTSEEEKGVNQRRVAFRRVNNALKGVKIEKRDENYDALRKFIDGINDAREAVHSTRLEELTRQYFTIGSFKGSAVDFDFKTGGDQLGAIAHVTRGPKTLTYYIKTHSEGTKSSQSSAARLLRPEELMAYKVLDLLGVGCECHFFGRDPKNFYIATLSAHHGGVVFREYEKFVKGEDMLRRSLWGCLDSLDAKSAVNERNAAQIEGNIGSDPIAQHFMQQTVLLDLLARIMLLQDLQTNSTNFGFVQVDGGDEVRVLDFRVMQTKSFVLDEGNFGGFLVGNGLFDYSADKTMYYLLKYRPEHLRVECARNVFAERLMGCGEETGFVETAYNAVHQALSQLSLPDEDGQVLRSLSVYKAALLDNFALFSRELENYHPPTHE